MLRNKSHHLPKIQIFPHHYQCILHCHVCSQLCSLLFQHTTAQQKIFTQNDHVVLLSITLSLFTCPFFQHHFYCNTLWPNVLIHWGCLLLLLLFLVTQSCPTLLWPPTMLLCHGISQARVLEWVATSSFRRSSWSRDQTFSNESPGKPGVASTIINLPS